LTRTGAPNVRPPSRLTAAYTSVAPDSTEAPHDTATKDRSAAMVSFAFDRPPMAIFVTLAVGDAPEDPKAAKVADAATNAVRAAIIFMDPSI
jgi:hypothetical protein